MTGGDSLQMLCLSDLMRDKAHGPEADNHACLTAVISQRLEGKKRAWEKRIVGAWQHCSWRRCAAGVTAAKLCTGLLTNASLNFGTRKENGAPCGAKRKWRHGKCTVPSAGPLAKCTKRPAPLGPRRLASTDRLCVMQSGMALTRMTHLSFPSMVPTS